MADLTVQKLFHGRAAARSIGQELRLLADKTFAERSPDALDAALRRGCWVYGAGGYGQAVARELVARGIAPRGFVDQRAEEPELKALALPVIAPEAFHRAHAANAAIIIAMHNYAADQLPVARWARGLGFADVLIPAELPDVLGSALGSYWLTGRAHTLEHLDALAETIALMADPVSVATLGAIARFRISGEIEQHPASTIADQYFPSDLPLPPGALRLVDGGAYVGDALEAAARAGRTIGEWYAFEPDPANFAQLAATVARSGVERAALFPCGLGDGLKQLRFATGGADGSRLAEGGDTTIQIVSLDEVLHHARPNFIKLDIEGAEAEALDGMTRTLAESTPRVAVSIYHKPADLWELPLKLHGMMPQAKLHVRQHGFNGFDTVLYAVP